MKMRFNLLSLLILLMVTGCDMDKSPSGEVYGWIKPGADFTEVGKALLECGLPHLNYLEKEVQELSNNDNATIDACMVQAGFRDRYGGPSWCVNHWRENLPICRPGAVIPKRSVKKRLNSPYCKRSPIQPECKP